MKWIKNTWSRIWNWTVNSWNRMWEVLLRHTACVYTSLALIILLLGYVLWSDIKHHSEVISLQKDAVVLVEQIDIQNNLLIEQRKLIDVQGQLIINQRKNIEVLKEVKEMHEDIIKQLIDYLKSIDEWPPSGPPVDPGSIA